MINFLITLRIPRGRVPQDARIGAEINLKNICAFLPNPGRIKMYLLVFILFCTGESAAQNSLAEGTLPKVDSSDFYAIMIPPDAATFMNERLSNLRIHDSAGKEVPYLLQEEQSTYSRKQFKEYPIIEKKQLSGCCTSLILSNAERKPINNISLVIRNAEVSKRATLLGSDDRKEWFALKEQFYLQSINNSSGTAEIKVIDFPLNNYSYLSLRMDDSTSAPLNIMKAGYYDVLTSPGAYTEVPVQIEAADSVAQKKTYIHLNLGAAYLVDKVELTMQGSPYFLRKAQLWEKKSRKTKKGEKKFYELVSSFEVSSIQASVVHLPSLKTNTIRVVINNEDNPSLNVASAKVYQLNRYLVAWLKKDEKYKVKLFDEQTDQPEYDITFFEDSIPDQPPVLELGKINSIGGETQAESSSTFFTTKYFIWIAIIGVIAVLGFLSVRLIRDASDTQK